MTNITSPIYTLSADMFDYVEGTMTADFAALDVPDDYDTDRFHFYCSACARKGHYTRLKHVEEQGEPKVKFEAPRRFNLFNHKDSVHRCDDPNRFREIDELAQRYNAKVAGAHRYVFADELPSRQTPVVIDREIKTVDRASRLANLAYHFMYDQPLMAQQQVRQAGNTQALRQHFFDASKTDKEAIFRRALAETTSGNALRAAVIFQTNADRNQWKRYEAERCVPATTGPHMGMSGGGKLRVINMLWCRNDDIYQHVKRTAFREKDRSAQPLLVTGEVKTNLRNFELAKSSAQKSGGVETVFAVVKIKDKRQVAAWDEDISFEAASANQNKIQEDRLTAMERARSPGLAL